VAAASPPIGDWRFDGNLQNSAGTALRMVTRGSPVFQAADVDGTLKTALVFAEGDGLKLSRIPRAARRTYSISVFFELDAVDSYRRILSFGPNDQDRGLYDQDGYLDLYPRKESQVVVLASNEWSRVTITRSNASKVVKVFVDEVKVIQIWTRTTTLLQDGCRCSSRMTERHLRDGEPIRSEPGHRWT
jgi:hypothetical protein